MKNTEKSSPNLNLNKFLDSEISENFRLTERQRTALKKLRLKTISDLLYHFPVSYGDSYEPKYIEDLIQDENAVIYGKIKNLKTGKTYNSKTAMSSATLQDETGSLKIIWFSQPYIAKMFNNDEEVKIEGKISFDKNNKPSIVNPKIEKVKKIPNNIGNSLFKDEEVSKLTLNPKYRESSGITSLWFYHSIQRIFSNPLFEEITDIIDSEILEKYHLPNLKTSLIWIHTPRKKTDAESARKRFAFQEVFFIQIQKQKEKYLNQKLDSYKIKKSDKDTKKFISKFPFKLTDSQKKSIDEILQDFQKPHPMARLLEGDVGSGKTAVAATIAEAVVTSRPHNQDFGNLQLAYMVPTEILAKQHFENFIEYFKDTNIKVALITSSGCKKFPSKVNSEKYTNISRSQLLKWVENGEIPIVIGTHSLISKSVKFKHLALVIIDEQHRFGTKQRQQLARKDKFIPHLLSMTATPIPRTLALTIFGDLDLSIIDQMPTGRKPIITEIVLENEREKTYTKIKKELSAGRQMYVICPRINEPDPDKEIKLNVKSVKAEAERLQKHIFSEYKIEILHSKMTAKEKESIMTDFENHKIDILVSTSVIEVGVNVPNSTIILIEGAERFGLAQLHQLRGRVIRGNHQAFCYIFTNSNTQKTIERLSALKTAKNGFELSEMDLKLRGIGELSGGKQWGVSDLAMEAIKNLKMVQAARSEAESLIEKDPELEKHPELEKSIIEKGFHFE